MIGLSRRSPVAGYEQAAGYAYPWTDVSPGGQLLKQGREVEYGFSASRRARRTNS